MTTKTQSVANGVKKTEQTKIVLNQLVADLSQMTVNIHQTHWYLQGKEFFTLHPLMDSYMDELNAQLDEVAERLIAIGGAPYSTVQEFIDHTGLTEKPAEFGTATEVFLEKLIHDFKYLRDLYQKGMDVTDEEGDLPTQDMFNGFKADLDKNIWMLNAYLGKDAQA